MDLRGALINGAGALKDSFMVMPAVDSYGTPPSAGFEGTNYGVAWVDSSWSPTWSAYGARISLTGSVLGTACIASSLNGVQAYPSITLACGSGNQTLSAFPNYTDQYDGRTYNTTRIWGRIGALAGVQEQTSTLTSRPQGTIVRGMLFMPEASSHKPQAASLLDISGRKVLDLKSGANDVRALAPGVYFVREAQVQPQAQDIRKVVITR